MKDSCKAIVGGGGHFQVRNERRRIMGSKAMMALKIRARGLLDVGGQQQTAVKSGECLIYSSVFTILHNLFLFY